MQVRDFLLYSYRVMSSLSYGALALALALDNVIVVKVARLPPFLGIVLRRRCVQVKENAYKTIKI